MYLSLSIHIYIYIMCSSGPGETGDRGAARRTPCVSSPCSGPSSITEFREYLFTSIKIC